MHLNCALIFSFLFISVVLADFHLEKQQPPLLPRVEISTNGTSYGPPVSYGDWAGGILERSPGSVTYVTGTFVVPYLQGEVGSALTISVGIDGMTCKSALLALGVTLQIKEGVIAVLVWSQFWPDQVVTHPNPKAFQILQGNRLTFAVKARSFTDASFTMINHGTKKSWSGELFNAPNHPLCQHNAFWVVALYQGNTLANFGTVQFDQLLAHVSGLDEVPRDAIPINIEQNRQSMTQTHINAQDGSITVTYG